jgi:carboxylesterase
MPVSVVAGAEPWSHSTGGSTGLLALHGFTGNPSSMRGIAEAAAAAGFDVELPLLPGHGTLIDDMLGTRWHDWTAEVEAAYQRLAARTDEVVVAGLSMGGALTLWCGLQHPEITGLVCVNPATMPPPPDVIEMIDEFLADGLTVVPGIGGDIADPAAVEIAYEGTPLASSRSFYLDGLAPMTGRYHELTMPLRLFTSRQDHVVDPAQSEHLAATYGGPVDHTWLERSYHVATQDYDSGLVVAESVAFMSRVAAS